MIQLLLRHGVLHNISLFMLPVFFMLPISAALPNFVMVQIFSRYGVSSWYRSFHATGFCHGTGFRRDDLQVSCIPPGAFHFAIRHTRKRELFPDFFSVCFRQLLFLKGHSPTRRHRSSRQTKIVSALCFHKIFERLSRITQLK